MNLSRACALEVPDGAAVSGVAFHPTKPVVAIAMDRSVSCSYSLSCGLVVVFLRGSQCLTLTGTFCWGVWRLLSL